MPNETQNLPAVNNFSPVELVGNIVNMVELGEKREGKKNRFK